MSNALPGPRACALAALAVALVITIAPRADARTVSAGPPASAAKTVGGGAVAGIPPSTPLSVPGARGRITRNGTAIPPAAAPAKVQAVIRAGNKIAKKPYKWGGGHGLLDDWGYDCSGSVSYTLRRARLMTASLASTGFMSWGRRGRGDWITIRANAGHAYMVVAGLRFDTSARSASGSRWTAQMRSSRGFVATHPAGL